MSNENDLHKKIEMLIQHYQDKADELKKDVDNASDSDATISVRKALYSLWRTCCNFVAELDELATQCELEEYVESCDECGFCNKN